MEQNLILCMTGNYSLDEKKERTKLLRQIRTVPTFRNMRTKSVVPSTADVEGLMENWKSKPPQENFNRKSIVSPGMKHNFLTLYQCVEYFFYTVLSITLSLIIYFSRSTLFVHDETMMRQGCSKDLDEDDPAICGLLDILKRGALQYRVLAAFIIGGFVISCVSIWKTRRTAYCMLCGSTRSLILNIGSILPIPTEDDLKIKETRKLMIRWAILGYELAVLKARDEIDTNEGKRYLEALHLLEKDEWIQMVDGDRHTTVWYWIQVKAKQLADEGVITWPAFLQLANTVTESRDKANDLMSKIDRDQPRPYIFVCAVLVNLNLVLISLAKVRIFPLV